MSVTQKEILKVTQTVSYSYKELSRKITSLIAKFEYLLQCLACSLSKEKMLGLLNQHIDNFIEFLAPSSYGLLAG